MVDFAGWDMPIQYTSIIEEHQAVRTAAGIFDISHMGRFVFEGPHAESLIQRIFTNDVSPAFMKVGQARYGLICNESGGILDDVLVYKFNRFWLMVVNASNREKISHWISKQPISFRAFVEEGDLTSSWAMVAVQGPHAGVIVSKALFANLENRNREFAQVNRLKYYHAQLMAEGDDPYHMQMIVSRTGYTGEDGFEVILPADKASVFVDLLMDSANQLGQDLKPCGLGARDTLRLEAAMPLYGHELNEDIDPIQAGLGWAVKMDKGDFIGREALARRRQDKTLRQRVGLELEGKRLAREGDSIMKDGKVIGAVTSGTFAPTLAKAIAMGYVDPTWTAPGTACEVDVRGKPVAVRVVPLPFYRRTK
jgi:aminomethyltransferase